MKHERDSTRADRVGQVKIAFTNKPLTAWGGTCTLAAKFLEQIGFREWVETQIPIEEESPNAKGTYGKVLAQFLTCLCGGTRFSHLGWWGHGLSAVQECFAVAWLPQATSVLTRFWGKIKGQKEAEAVRSGACRLTRLLLEQEEIKGEDLYLDSSVCERYGKQEGALRGYNPKKHGRPSHHPLKAAVSSGYVVNLWNRSGNTHSAHRCVEFYEQTLRELPEGLVIGRTLADSGFYDIGFIEHLEGLNKLYTIAVPISRVIQSQLLALEKWESVAAGIEVAEFYFQHHDLKWTRPRRYTAIRQHILTRPSATGKQPMLFREMEEHREYRYSVLITNDEQSAPMEIWRGYRPRAKEENCIKDLKEGYGWDSFNVHGFWATEAVMVIVAMVFHNLILYLNRKVLSPEGVIPQLKTMRSKYFAWPAVLGNAGGTPTLRLGIQDKSLRGKIRYWLRQIGALSLKLNCNAVDTLIPVMA